MEGGSAVGQANGLGWLIEALGAAVFDQRLISYLNLTCGAEHCATFQVTEHAPLAILAASFDGSNAAKRNADRYLREQYWRVDDMLCEARHNIGRPDCAIGRMEVKKIQNVRFRSEIYGRDGIVERVRVIGSGAEATISLSVLKTVERGCFSDREIGDLRAAAPLLLSLLCKHASLVAHKFDMRRILSDLSFVEHVVAKEADILPRREAEVVTRILFGMSTSGISLELGISEETVMTYRKRVYSRLSIGSQRELLLWYLQLLGNSSSDYAAFAGDPRSSVKPGRLVLQ